MKLEHLSRYGVVDRTSPLPPDGLTATRRDSLAGETPRQDSHDRDLNEFSVVYLAGYRHGRHQIADVCQVLPHNLALISRETQLNYLDVTRAVFLDTETTGLGMGTGTYVFLVGLGYVVGRDFHVKQFFLPGPQDEHAFLDDLSDFLSQFAAIVTFNGKAFDWPLLENRFVLHRRRPPFTDPLHLDLLHPARRLWKRRLQSCALSSLEANILAVARTRADVPGYLIPHLYFQFQSTGDRSILDGVMYHNLQDVLSLAALTVHVNAVVGDPHGGMVAHGEDYFSLARTYDLMGDTALALECFEEAVRRLPPGSMRQDCLVGLSTVQKRERRWEAAHQTWHRLLDGGGSYALFARIELAKFYEHVDRDFMQAIEHVQYALDLAELAEAPWPEASRRELERRQSRLVSRAMRNRSWIGSGARGGRR